MCERKARATSVQFSLDFDCYHQLFTVSGHVSEYLRSLHFALREYFMIFVLLPP